MSKSKEEYVEINLKDWERQQRACEISLSDLITTEEYKERCPTQESCNRDDLLDLLFIYGMDTSLPIEDQIVAHRNWKGEVVNCMRWVGTQRSDEEWKKVLRSINKYQN